jgi:hypothetical protein
MRDGNTEAGKGLETVDSIVRNVDHRMNRSGDAKEGGGGGVSSGEMSGMNW